MATNRRISLLFTIALFVAAASFDSSKNEDAPSLRSLTHHELRMGEEAGYSYVDRLTQLEEDLIARGMFIPEGSHLSRMAKFKQPTQRVMELSRQNARVLETTRFLKNEHGLSDRELEENLLRYTNEANSSYLTPPTCSVTKYRLFDGSCNNQALTNLGQSSTVYRRFTTPVYNDGVSDPRNTSTNGSTLPLPRAISTGIIGPTDNPLSGFTSLLMQFGQLINHDIEQTSTFTYSNGSAISCCSSTNMIVTDTSSLSPYCFPIEIPTNDPFINKNNTVRQTCMNFVRSSTGPSRLSASQASVTYANQLNSNTHWLDASTVYGSDNTTASSLREASGAGYLLLMSTDSNGRQLLPVSSGCTTNACFTAGDSRVTEHPQLTVMHTLWAREHNRVAKALYALNNSGWTNETIFQEARRIVVAEMQHITYNEFLPNLLGSTVMSNWGLSPLSSGFFTNFTNYTSGPISNEFATAAFRMGHSMVQGTVSLYDANNTQTNYSMTDYFNDASVVYNNKTFIDSVIRGLITQNSLAVDRFITNSLWLTLFAGVGGKVGFDIAALNIQRGRDHGLPGYNTFRTLCGFSNATSFSSLSQTAPINKNLPNINTKDVALLETLYNSTSDIDLFLGGIMENSTNLGGVVGPTYSCLIADTFYKLKYGDRYFYELGGQAHSFSSSQLAAIKTVSIARILCDNQDGTVTSMQPKAFLVSNTGTNAQVSCTNTTMIPSLNLTLWKGEKTY